MNSPILLNDTEYIGPSCPYKVYKIELLNKSHILTVESSEQLTKYFLEG